MAGFGLGFAAGGFADTFQRGNEQQSLDQYRMQELKLQQQAQQNAEQRFQMSRIDAIRTDALKNISESVESLKIAGKSNDEISKQLMPWVEQVATLTKKSGVDPASVYSQFATTLARPAATQTERAMAQAKDPYGEQKKKAEAELLQSEAGMNRELFGGGQAQPSTPQGQAAPPATAQPQAAVPSGGMALDPNDPGDKYLATQPEQLRQVIKDIAEYRRNPTSLAGRTIKGTGSSFRDLVMSKVEQYAAAKGEPYDQTNFAARNRTATAFAGGVEGRTTRSFNVLVSHLDTLKEATTALKNGDYTALNRLKNIIASETGHPAPDTFDAIKAIVADELAKAVIGSGSGALGDRQEIAKTVNNAKSPAILASVMNNYQKLAAGQLEGLKQQYESSGFPAGSFDSKFLLPKTRQFFQQGGKTEGGKDASRVQSSDWQSTAIPGVRIRKKSSDEIPTLQPGQM